ncbi:MAG TPA: acyl-CoA dehydrogenase family protein [Acidimicrobiia bacterium]|nr:acyl-CoA dehydrogenase family protein [Acidimicrobiia bacterium]
MADTVTFARSEEQTMLVGTLRDMLGDMVDMDGVRDSSLTTAAMDKDVWRAIADMGLVGLTLSSAHGGADSPFTDLAVVFEELGRKVVPVPLLSSVMAAAAIDKGGTEEQKAEFLPSIASGSSVATVAFLEDAHGSPDHPRTTATEDAGRWRITGTKRYVTDAIHADLFIVSADTGDGIGVFIIPAGTEGVSVTPIPALDATRPLGELSIDATVASHNRLTGADGSEIIRRACDVGVVAIAQEQVGGASRCLEMSVDYARSRYQFGRAIGSFQAVKHRCADMLVALEHARSVAWHAAVTLDDPDEAAIMVPLAKAVCSDAFLKVAGDTIQIHGGIGFTWEHDAHLYLKRAKADSLLLGSVGSHRDRLGDALGI